MKKGTYIFLILSMLAPATVFAQTASDTDDLAVIELELENTPKPAPPPKIGSKLSGNVRTGAFFK